MNEKERARQIVSRKCGRVIGLKMYLVPVLEELELNNEQLYAFFKMVGDSGVRLWIMISEFISENKIEDRKEGTRQFVIETLKRSRCPVEKV